MRINEIVYQKKKSWQTIKSFTVSVCGAVIPVRARIVLQEWTSDWAYVENGVEETGLHGPPQRGTKEVWGGAEGNSQGAWGVSVPGLQAGTPVLCAQQTQQMLAEQTHGSWGQLRCLMVGAPWERGRLPWQSRASTPTALH